MLTLFLILLLLIGVGALGLLFFQKWDQLKLLDPESSSDVRSKKLKYDILRQRIERRGKKYIDKTKSDVLKPVWTKVQELIRIIAGKLTAAERSYQKRQKEVGVVVNDADALKEMFKEAEKYIHDNLYDSAEKTVIAIVSSDPRNVEAYELLGRLYLLKKDYELARETFAFLKKLSKDDPSVIASLGEVELKLNHLDKGFRYFKQALELSPNNPKYLDFFIDVAIKIGDVHQAMIALDKLSEVNPDNNKISDFEERIEILRKEKTNKE